LIDWKSKTKMVVFTEEPKNAVINSKPTYLSILWHMRLSDWGILVGLTGAGVAWGYMAGTLLSTSCVHPPPPQMQTNLI
jgi:hypothetical protein